MAQKHPVPWSWERPQQEAFDTLIKRLTEPPVLSYPDYTLPFELRVDASRDGLCYVSSKVASTV